MSSFSTLSPSLRWIEILMRRTRRMALMMTACVALLAVEAHDWPEFRGPTGQGLSPAKNVPIRWSGTSNVVWKIPLPVAGWSSPVLVKQRLYPTGSCDWPARRSSTGSGGLAFARSVTLSASWVGHGAPVGPSSPNVR